MLAIFLQPKTVTRKVQQTNQTIFLSHILAWKFHNDSSSRSGFQSPLTEPLPFFYPLPVQSCAFLLCVTTNHQRGASFSLLPLSRDLASPWSGFRGGGGFRPSSSVGFGSVVLESGWRGWVLLWPSLSVDVQQCKASNLRGKEGRRIIPLFILYFWESCLDPNAPKRDCEV